MRYISEMTNKEIGEEIERLCKLADLQLPELPKETAEFLKDEFSVYEDKIIRLAFDQWIGGNIKVQAYAKANANFLSKVLKAYIEDHKHKLRTKPRQYIQSPKVVEQKTPEQIKKERLESVRRGYEAWTKQVIRHEEGLYLSYPYLMGVYTSAEELGLLPDTYDEERVQKLAQKYIDYRARMDQANLRNADTEVKRKSIEKLILKVTDTNLDFHKVGRLGYYFEIANSPKDQ